MKNKFSIQSPKPDFHFSSEEYAKYDRIDWESIYKIMLQDIHLKKILKKNNYYGINNSEINQASQVIETIPLKDDLKVQYFTDHYQQNLSKYLKNQITLDELLFNLNYPRSTCRKNSLDRSVNIQPQTKRLNIRDIKMVINRLNVLSHEKTKDSTSVINDSISTADIYNGSMLQSHRKEESATNLKFIKLTKNDQNLLDPMISKLITKNDQSKKIVKNDKNILDPARLKYSIIKNLILEKFKEREQRKFRNKTHKFSLHDNKLPQILQNIEAIEQDFIERIANKNLCSSNPKNKSFYLNHERKMSDGLLKSARKPLSFDSNDVSHKKLLENLKVQNIIDSNLKNRIHKTSDSYLENLQNFKNLSRNFNKKIVLKDSSEFFESRRFSLKSGCNNNRSKIKKDIGFWDYLHNSHLINDHKAGLISNIFVSDMMMYQDKKLNESGIEIKVKCERELRNVERRDKILEQKKATNDGKYTQLANNILKKNDVSMKPLKRYMKLYCRSYDKVEECERKYDEGNDSLQSVNENKLDSLYNESINLQKKMKSKERGTFSDKMKRLIKLEHLNNRIFETTQRKLKN